MTRTLVTVFTIPLVASLAACEAGFADGLLGSHGRRSTDAADTDPAPPAEPLDAPLPPTWSEDASVPPAPHDRFASSQTCAGCHPTQFAQWSKSMHARALTGPIMVAQTNQDARGPLADVPGPDPKRMCVNCHAPTAAAVTKLSSFAGVEPPTAPPAPPSRSHSRRRGPPTRPSARPRA